TGVYENEYRNEGGTWKIRRMHLYPSMITPYEQGWGRTSLPASRYEPSLPPDAPSSGGPSTYDHVFVAPYTTRIRVVHGLLRRPAPPPLHPPMPLPAWTPSSGA
ncbi:MAG TPA: hypothetical protein VN755_04605, partial [Steroidobacteraceae bacterium]|nr:hypothetical protein [Steroidobacteraceae bacterium]